MRVAPNGNELPPVVVVSTAATTDKKINEQQSQDTTNNKKVNVVKHPCFKAERISLFKVDIVEHPCFSQYIKQCIYEDEEQTFCITILNAVMYFLVKLVPCLGFMRCCKPHKLKRHNKPSMKAMIATLHLGPPVDYDAATNLINTILLVCALFLAFVAASATAIEAENYLEADLVSCQLGWGHHETCIQIDSGGYFGNYNATGLLRINATYNMQPGDPVDLNALEYQIWPDAVTEGLELPSVAVNRWTAVSISALMITLIFSILWYLILVLSGARSMGEVMMGKFWDLGVVLIVIYLIFILLAILAWAFSLQRVMQVLLPHYPVTGIEFGYFTNKEDVTTQGQYFLGWALDGVAINTLFFVVPLFICFFIYVVVAEWKIVKNRPTTPKEFIFYTLARLNKTHGLNFKKKKADGNVDEHFYNEYKFKQFKCTCPKEEQQEEKYKVPFGRKQCIEVDNVLKCFQAYGIKMDPTDNKQGVDNVVENMDHFLDMWPYLDWENEHLKKNNNDDENVNVNGIRPLYHTAFSSMYAELYPGHF